MSQKHTITMEEIQNLINNGCSTFSLKDNSVRGFSTVCADQVKVGDEVIINNYFKEIIE